MIALRGSVIILMNKLILAGTAFAWIAPVSALFNGKGNRGVRKCARSMRAGWSRTRRDEVTKE